MADPSPADEANLIRNFDGLAVPPIDHTFYALHMTVTYEENVVAREALGSNLIQMDHNCFGQPGNELMGNFRNFARNVKLMSEEMSNFTGNQQRKVSTDVFEYLKVPSPNCGSNLTKGLNNLSDPNKSIIAHNVAGEIRMKAISKIPIRLHMSLFTWGSGNDPLAASLYVLRNDTLVKIDGNLIIEYVLESEKAMASHGEVLIRKMERRELPTTLVIFE
ncbi:hypothetical protein H5410_022747 [Solanum commersonii]|uniref:Uncharacterized protein n=1 Tax=Solanum commersonii TaxID=4109 RepID=A0A9J5ZFM7_SOLCO|nr:hypothetical protein H5410_022747 [Solanum commersonii]